MDIRIRDLPEKLKKIALERAESYSPVYSEDSPISCFHWQITPEGDKFWRKIRDTGIIPEEYGGGFITKGILYEIY